MRSVSSWAGPRAERSHRGKQTQELEDRRGSSGFPSRLFNQSTSTHQIGALIVVDMENEFCRPAAGIYQALHRR